ncbi:MAG: radical SAM protein [Succinivibrionaceae bacterium]|nr:radical SAM protein [Succinivibrionaceae bacterium]
MTLSCATAFVVNEIFASINGEGQLAGEAAIFVRLAGCNLKCTYCDTCYAQSPQAGTLMTVSDILTKVKSFLGIKNITLTGGEPLFRRNVEVLLEAFTSAGYLVNIETNGAINLKPFITAPYADKLIFCCDFKLPSSGETARMNPDNLALLRPQDALKLVIGTAQDLAYSHTLCQKPHDSFIYLSAVYGQMKASDLVDALLAWGADTDISKLRVQLQLHKYIWDPNQRGV